MNPYIFQRNELIDMRLVVKFIIYENAKIIILENLVLGLKEAFSIVDHGQIQKNNKKTNTDSSTFSEIQLD